MDAGYTFPGSRRIQFASRLYMSHQRGEYTVNDDTKLQLSSKLLPNTDRSRQEVSSRKEQI